MNDRIPYRYTGKGKSRKWFAVLLAVLFVVFLTVLYVLGLIDWSGKSNEIKPPNQQNMQQPDVQLPDDAPDNHGSIADPGTWADNQSPVDTGNSSKRPATLLFEMVDIDKIIGYTAPAGYNSVAIVLKNKSGMYAADTLGEGALNQAIAALKAEGLYVVGAMYAFRDDAAVRANIDCGIHYDEETVWLDGDMKRWLNPYMDKARTLVLQSVDKVCQYDVDEVMLLECNFPSSGLHSKINYRGTDTLPKEQVLKDFLTIAVQQIKNAGKAVSVAIPTGNSDAMNPVNTGVGFDQKSCGVDAVYTVDRKFTFSIK
jgi:hypothetical protein